MKAKNINEILKIDIDNKKVKKVTFRSEERRVGKECRL